MRNVRSFKVILLFCVMFALPGCRFHRPAYYPVQFSMKGGLPCFSVTNNREIRASHPEITVIDVYPVDSKEVMLLWSRMFPRNQMKQSPDECVVYGEGEEAAPILQKGVRYGVAMRASINDDGIFYKSYFCLSETSEGKTEIHRVSRVDNSICKKK